MRAKFCDEQFAERLVSALAEKFPEIGVAERGESGNFEFEQMVLRGAGRTVSGLEKRMEACKQHETYFRSTA